VLLTEPASIADAAGEWAASESLLASPGRGIEIVPYKSAGRLLLHVVRHEPTSEAVALRLPASITPVPSTARLYAPGEGTPQSLPLIRGEDGVRLTLPAPPVYCVVVVEGTI
jgi:hypothetical protein